MKIFINGIRASKTELDVLLERCKKGLDRIKDMHTTKRGNLAITTI